MGCGLRCVGVSKLIGVRKLPNDGIVPRRLEKLDRPAKDRIQQRSSVTNIKVERHQLASEMELRIVVERRAAVKPQPLLDRPRKHIAQGVKIKREIQRD